MKLLTKEIISKLPPIYSNEKNPDPVAMVKFFDPCGSWTWYAIEGAPAPDIFGALTDFEFFGLVQGQEEELGYFTLEELSSYRGPLGIGIERDLYFEPTPLSKLRKA